jgi:hypothetical protein
MAFDLHWHIMHLHLSPIFDEPMWEASLPLQVGKVSTRVLCPEDQLIHILFNGCVNEGGVNLRWLPDALLLLRQEAEFNWDRLVAQCQQLEFILPAVAMLEYLRTSWDMPVSVDALHALRRTPVRYRMRKVYECLNVAKSERSWTQVFWLLYTQYLGSQPHPPNGFLPLGFVEFLRRRWTLDGVGKTLRYAVQRANGITASKAKGSV